MTEKNLKRGSRKKILRFTILIIALILLGVEAGILVRVRGLFPGGIAPVVICSPETETLLSDPDRPWVTFDEVTLSKIRSAIERDIVVSDDQLVIACATYGK